MTKIISVDIGSHKISVCSADLENNGSYTVRSLTTSPSEGFSRGEVVNTARFAKSLNRAISTFENQAGENITEVCVTFDSSKFKSFFTSSQISLQNKKITKDHIKTLISMSIDKVRDKTNYDIVHYFPITYLIDGKREVENPEGLEAQNSLALEIHLIGIDTNVLAEIASILSQSNIEVSFFNQASFCNGLALIEEAAEYKPYAIIDFGATKTSLSLMKNKKLYYSSTIALGGANIANDLSLALQIPMDLAEKVKTLYARGSRDIEGVKHVIDLNTVSKTDNDEYPNITQENIDDIVIPRLEEIFEMLYDQWQKIGADQFNPDQIIITGGSANIKGLKELIGPMFNYKIELGTYNFAHSKSLKPHIYGATIGQIIKLSDALKQRKLAAQNTNKGIIGRMVNWLKENA